MLSSCHILIHVSCSCIIPFPDVVGQVDLSPSGEDLALQLMETCPQRAPNDLIDRLAELKVC